MEFGWNLEVCSLSSPPSHPGKVISFLIPWVTMLIPTRGFWLIGDILDILPAARFGGTFGRCPLPLWLVQRWSDGPLTTCKLS